MRASRIMLFRPKINEPYVVSVHHLKHLSIYIIPGMQKPKNTA